jgi:hypothetical protein
MIVLYLVLILFYSPHTTYAVPNMSNDHSTNCTSTGKHSQNGLMLVKCCWYNYEDILKDTNNKVKYCSTCEDGGTRGKINCTEPAKESIGKIPSDVISNQDGVLEDTITPISPPPSVTSPPRILEELQQDDEKVVPEYELLEQQPANQETTEERSATETSQSSTAQ